MEEFANRVIEFISANREWAFWLAMIFAAGETTAFVSVLIPSTAILVGVGALVATGALDFLPIWAGATLGALIGSTFSFWLGRRYGEPMFGVWPLSKNPDLVEKSRVVFARRGALAVTIGHFLTFLRPVVFLMAGMAGMRFLTFFAANVVGATAWAFVIPKSGEVGGDVLGWIWRTVTGG
jgi:membrane protein DedA with SNARE-associated domain